MKWAVDARMVHPQHGHGIQTYVEALASLPGPERVYLVGPGRKLALQKHPFWKDQLLHESSVPFLSWKEAWVLPEELERLPVQAVHFPSFMALAHCRLPYVMTLHDLIHLDYGNILHKLYYRYALKPFAQKAQALWTVSKYSQMILQQWLDRKVHVHYTPVPSAAIESREGALFRCVMQSKKHKNQKLLQKLLNYFPIECFQSGDFSRFVSRAHIWLAPSFAEGAGLMPLEALAGGASVLASDIPEHRELLGSWEGKGVQFLNPDQPKVWIDAMLKMQHPLLEHKSSLAVQECYSRERFVQQSQDLYRPY